MKQIIKVLVVDDSAFIRKIITQILSRSPFIEVVGTARDGKEALEKVEALNPDVVTLDLIMPEMDGIEFLKAQMAKKPLPVVVVSIATEMGELALKALDEGAIDFIQKPTALATERIFEVSDDLISKVKAASMVPLSKMPLKFRPLPPFQKEVPPKGTVDSVVIGVSTGGPQALKFLIAQLPEDFPVPICVAMHMPVGYTELYAQRLDGISKVRVKEASEGDYLQPGLVLIAPGGKHLTLIKSGDKVLAHLDEKPFDSPHKPSVNELFRSASEVFEKRVLGIIMTGMGTDGKEGAAWIKSKGGLIFTEDESSCVVFGMPKAVLDAGLSDRTVPLEKMVNAIMEVL